MLVRSLAEHYDLPECFAVRCACGWKGRRVTGHLFVMGHFENITEDISRLGDCPKCGKMTSPLLDVESMRARLAWAVGKVANIGGRGCPEFPCTCSHCPPLDLRGEVALHRAVCGDTVFNSGHELIRVASDAVCRGCSAPCRVAIAELVTSRDLDEAFRIERDETDQFRNLVPKRVEV